MKSETLSYGMELLVILDEMVEVSFEQLQEKTKIKGEELRELLKYLKQKEYITWKNPLFIGTLEKIELIDTDKIKLDHKGMEVVLGQRDYFKDLGSITQTIHNQTNVINSSEVLIAKTTGKNSPITQTQNIEIRFLVNELEKELKNSNPDKSKISKTINKIIKVSKDGASAVITQAILKVLGI